MRLRILMALGLLWCALSCKDEALPKPKAMLRLEYPEVQTNRANVDRFNFEYNTIAQIKEENDGSLTIDYPSLKGAVFITYKEVDGNLDKLLSDAQKLSYEHVVKADNILEQPFVNNEDRVYGMFYEVKGDAASQAQFYATDSIRNFVTGSLYFYAKPNYDSIYPAAVYLQKDIRRVMETLRWN
ncbi:gliding motility lipoprotein GldD [Poritiphilus flavus]|uniref:Gliding motility lipoprotein GldD n=1 Tax=Poritiphilus flavus TaxID=2697053 RepID=A0A6L9ECY6_9FLAO|nr:gliding motility lipoprotein GldD [Poritiphilus flavus]NAS12620.1 gliding motility lipoprotein GldD [Poritiphilus flavus]